MISVCFDGFWIVKEANVMDDLSGPAGPLYQQVYDAVMARIISGELAPGVMLPSEFDLAAHYAVSQGTARKALSKLELSGLVERHQGKGTFVATTTDETSLFHFFRLRQSDGAQVIPQLVSETVRKRPANAREAAALGLAARASVFEVMRVRSINDAVVCAEQSVLDVVKFPGLKDRGSLPNALYPLYQRNYGITIARADEQLRAVAVPEAVASLLALAVNTPVMEVERRAIGISGGVMEFRLSYYLTQNLHYAVSLR